MNNGDIYRETILDHYRNPRNKGRLSNHDVSVQDSNPLCGDEIEIHSLLFYWTGCVHTVDGVWMNQSLWLCTVEDITTVPPAGNV